MKLFFFKGVFVLSLISFLASCSKSDSHHDECHECHLAYALPDGGETAWDIENADGGDEFCGDELNDVESADYIHVVVDTLYSSSGDTLLPGSYSAKNGYEVHCEEHGAHDDDHDH